MMKRALDLALSLVAGILLLGPCLVIAIAVKITSRGPVLYWSDRFGADNALFRMPKFRSMYVDAPSVATHLLNDPARWVTPVGRFLRKSSLDEVPQLWNILRGEMSLVGPRPALFNQHDLVAMRTQAGVHRLRPGLTGWAQINGRDELSIPQKVAFDEWYLRHQSLPLDLKILWWTLFKVTIAHGVSH